MGAGGEHSRQLRAAFYGLAQQHNALPLLFWIGSLLRISLKMTWRGLIRAGQMHGALYYSFALFLASAVAWTRASTRALALQSRGRAAQHPQDGLIPVSSLRLGHSSPIAGPCIPDARMEVAGARKNGLPCGFVPLLRFTGGRVQHGSPSFASTRAAGFGVGAAQILALDPRAAHQEREARIALRDVRAP